MGACSSSKLSPSSAPDSATEGSSKKPKKKKLSKSQQEVDAVLHHLAVPPSAVKKFLVFFRKMDVDDSGFITMTEFLDFIDLEKYYTPFVVRCFGAMDFNKKGTSAGVLDPTEFTVGLYNLCIMSRDLLETFVFNLYDEVHDGNLYQKQVEKLVADSTPHAEGAAKALVESVFKSLDKDGNGHLSKEEFSNVDSKMGSLLRPMYTLQTFLQQKCLGESFWSGERSRMRDMMKEFGQGTVIDLLANRIAAKHETKRVKMLEDNGEDPASLRKLEAKRQKESSKKLVQSFDSVQVSTGPDKVGSNNAVKFSEDTNNGGPMFAGAMKEKDDALKAKNKAKLKQKRSAKAAKLALDGEVPSPMKKGPSPTKKKTSPNKSKALNVKGAYKQAEKAGSFTQ